jgi:hypothetical protein
MSSSEIHEHYGWLSFEEGFFQEWRDEVARRLTILNPHESRRENARGDLSAEVYKEMLQKKMELKLFK